LAAGPLNDSINVTPLADVMLVLLILFMVVTPLMKPGVDVRVPEAENPREHPGDESTLILSMREDGALFLNRDRIAEEDVSSKLSAILETRTEKTLFLKASEALDFGRVLSMMDTCRRAGVAELALVTREENPATGAPPPEGSGRARGR
jgi:biopolymer transport protein ExbD